MSDCRSAAGISHASIFSKCMSARDRSNALRATLHERVSYQDHQPWNRWRARHSHLSNFPFHAIASDVSISGLSSAQKYYWNFLQAGIFSAWGVPAGSIIAVLEPDSLTFPPFTEFCLRIHRLLQLDPGSAQCMYV
jgi:hypothetical protein